jgi:hypothetical protein
MCHVITREEERTSLVYFRGGNALEGQQNTFDERGKDFRKYRLAGLRRGGMRIGG